MSLFEAWTRWAAGDDSLKQAHLWGLQILWWARIGKFLAFGAGLVLVVDIIGPERILTAIRQQAARHAERRERRAQRPGWLAKVRREHPDLLPSMGKVAGIGVGVAVLTLLPAGVRYSLSGAALLLGLAWSATKAAPRVITWFYARKEPVNFIRATSLVLFVLGFHFDMLGS